MNPHPRLWHWLFEAGVTVKATLGGLEALSGIGLLLTPNALVLRMVSWLTHFQIADDPSDRLASYAQNLAAIFPVGVQHFYGVYLFFHGGLKLGIMLLLWMRKLWAYPVAMAVLALFALYEGEEWLRDGSPFLAMLCVFDLFMIGLVWKEWRALKPATA